MSDIAYVGIKNEDNQFECVYIHWMGVDDASELYKNWGTNPEKVLELVRRGNARSTEIGSDYVTTFGETLEENKPYICESPTVAKRKFSDPVYSLEKNDREDYIWIKY